MGHHDGHLLTMVATGASIVSCFFFLMLAAVWAMPGGSGWGYPPATFNLTDPTIALSHASVPQPHSPSPRPIVFVGTPPAVPTGAGAGTPAATPSA